MKRELSKRFGNRLRLAEPMRVHTTLAVGGPAECFLRLENVDDLRWLCTFLEETSMEVLWLGGGSNLFVGDFGVPGLVVKVALHGIERLDEERICVGAGEKLSALVRWSVEAGWAGFDVLAGIPGSVGGAVAGNAGAYGQSISEHCSRIQVCRGNELLWLDREDVAFVYRGSSLRENKDLIVAVEFAKTRGESSALRASVRSILLARSKKVPPPTVACAGSWFKNLDATEPGGRRRAAGWFLDQCGMKGQSVGAAQVWHDHANIIVNRGGASAQDVACLVHRMQQAVEERFGILLEAEVRSIGRFREDAA